MGPLSILLLLLSIGWCGSYTPYWKDYWLPNLGYPYESYPQNFPEYRPQYYPSVPEYHPNVPEYQPSFPGYYPKYPHYPRNDHSHHVPQPRGEDAYPGKFLGMGKVNTHYGGRQVELVCSLNSGEDSIVSNVVWNKVKGYFPSLENQPPYHCPKCIYFPIDYDDHRIKAYDYHGKSILLIQEVHQEDYGIYRCSATAQVSYRGDIETVYQIVKL